VASSCEDEVPSKQKVAQMEEGCIYAA